MSRLAPPSPPRLSSLLSGLLGGLVVLVAGAVLIETDVIDTGDTTREVVRQAPITRPTGDDGEGRTVADIYRNEGQGVVFIQSRGVTADDSPFGLPPREGTASGSGFVIDKEGRVVTNAHVVEGADEVRVRFQQDGDFVDADVKGVDPSTDLAVLEVDPDDAKLVPISLGNSSTVRVGDPVVAIGNPFGAELQRTVTTGIVSAVQRSIQAPNGFTISGAIQTDASINPGNSGGPLLDADGRVIGINSQIATGGESRGSVGIGFAVPVNTLKKVLPDLRQGEEVERGFIGITTTPITDDLARDLNLPTDDGALVVDVRSGSPADEAGLRAGRTRTSEGLTLGGDIIVEIAGRRIDSPEDVAAAVESRKPGDTIEIEFFRGDDRRSVRLKLGKRPESAESAAPEPDDDGGILPLP